MTQRQPAQADLEACYQHTDLEWRLAQIPPDATCRGAFFKMLDDRAGELGDATQQEYRRFFRMNRFSVFRMYPLADYLTRLVVLAQIHYGDEAIYRGIRELQSSAFDAWGQTLLGRAALAVVDPSMGSMLRMLERAYASQTVVSHTRFTVRSQTDDEIVVSFASEFVYIEHAMVGAIEGVARVCGTRADVVAELDGPFDGIVRVKLLGSAGEHA